MLLIFHVELRTTNLAPIKSSWSLKCITLSEESQTQESTCCMIPFTCYCEEGKCIETKKKKNNNQPTKQTKTDLG